MKPILFLFFITISFYSCVGNKKITAVRNTFGDLKNAHEQELKRVRAIENKAEVKLNERRIDFNIQGLVQKRLATEQLKLDESKRMIDSLESIVAVKKLVRKNYKTIILPLLDSLQQRKDKFAERLTVYLMIEEGLNLADFKLFDLAAFFGPGRYIIPDDKTELAMQSFSPIIDSLSLFSDKYSSVNRTATLIILGFADGAGFDTNSELYDTLLVLTGKNEPSKQELNQKLSELRAKELIKQMTAIFLKKAPGFKEFDKLKIVYVGQGKGEEFPLTSIKDYREDDERRRIVLCYWVVLPD